MWWFLDYQGDSHWTDDQTTARLLVSKHCEFTRNGRTSWESVYIVMETELTSYQVHVPKTEKTYCKKCNKHTEHKVTQYKAGKASLRPQGRSWVLRVIRRKASIRYEAEGLWRSDKAHFPQEGACGEFSLRVGEADKETGSPSWMQGVQGEDPETSEEMQDSWNWREEEQGCSGLLSISMPFLWIILLKDFSVCVKSKYFDKWPNF